MFVEMTCNCGASFQIDSGDNDTLPAVWAHSFVNAHSACGYMLKPFGVMDATEKIRRYDSTAKEKEQKEVD